MTPVRVQLVAAACARSYDLLFDEERRVFERMSAFAGPCPLDAAEQVCAGDPVGAENVADLLARLVDKSLVTATPTGRGIRFSVLQTLAQYGEERLATRGDAADVRARHARWAASIADVPDGAHTTAWFAAIGESLDDVRRGMESALADADADTSLGIACGLGWFWSIGGVAVDDCWRSLTSGLALGPTDTARRVRALAVTEQVALAQGRDRALEYGEEAVGLARAAGDRRTLALAALLHGPALTGLFDQRERGIRLLTEAGVLLEAEGDNWRAATGALACGTSALARGDLDQARDLLRRAADRFSDIDDAQGAAAALHNLADLAIARGRYDDAIAALCEALDGLDAGAAAGITSMAQLGCLCAMQGRSAEADRWHARALAAAENQRHLPSIAFACNAKGLTLRRRGDLAEAGRCHQRALSICHERGLPASLAMAHASLGYIAELRDDDAAAERHYRIGLNAARETANRQAQALALEGLASTASLRDDPRTAGRLLGAAAALREGNVVAAVAAHMAHRGSALGHLDRLDIDRTIARVAGCPAYDGAYAEGLHAPQAVLNAVRA
jgi:tetratricopeptide (TPR) repeat protein